MFRKLPPRHRCPNTAVHVASTVSPCSRNWPRGPPLQPPHPPQLCPHPVGRFLAWCEEQGIELRQVTLGFAGRFPPHYLDPSYLRYTLA